MMVMVMHGVGDDDGGGEGGEIDMLDDDGCSKLKLWLL